MPGDCCSVADFKLSLLYLHIFQAGTTLCRVALSAVHICVTELQLRILAPAPSNLIVSRAGGQSKAELANLLYR